MQLLVLLLKKMLFHKIKIFTSLVSQWASITKTYLYNFDPLKPNLYSITGVYRGIQYFSYFCSKSKIVGTL